MLKNEFLNALKNRLSGIPKEDIDKTVEYYNEIISDKQEDGMTEEEAINSLEAIDDIVKNTLNGITIKKLVKEKLQLNRRLSTLEIVLLSVTSIVWVPLLVVLLAVILVLYICLWSGVIAIGAGAISCAATSLVTLLGFLDIITGNFGSGIFLIGIGFASLGVAILLGILTYEFSKVMIIVCKKIVLKIKSFFIRGE